MAHSDGPFFLDLFMFILLIRIICNFLISPDFAGGTLEHMIYSIIMGGEKCCI